MTERKVHSTAPLTVYVRLISSSGGPVGENALVNSPDQGVSSAVGSIVQVQKRQYILGNYLPKVVVRIEDVRRRRREILK